MKPTQGISAALVAIGCVTLVASQWLGLASLAVASKFIASCGFIALALASGARQSPYGVLILVGLAFSWFGDMFLIGTSRSAFLAGLGAFLLAHLAYVTAFVTLGLNRRWTLAAAVPVMLLGVAVLAWLGPQLPDALAWPVRLYTAAISLMVITAAGASVHAGNRLILAGALMFFVSDLSVAALRLADTSAATYIWGLPLYYGGQVALAFSVSQSRSH